MDLTLPPKSDIMVHSETKRGNHKDCPQTHGDIMKTGKTNNGRWTTNKDLNKLISYLVKQGAIVEKRGNGHIRIINPKNSLHFGMGSTSRSSSIKLQQRDAIKIGFHLK